MPYCFFMIRGLMFCLSNNDLPLPDRNFSEPSPGNKYCKQYNDDVYADQRGFVPHNMKNGPGSLRFNELKRMVEGISSRVLSAELKELELNGFIRRTTVDGAQAAVEYELTEYSHTLRDVLSA